MSQEALLHLCAQVSAKDRSAYEHLFRITCAGTVGEEVAKGNSQRILAATEGRAAVKAAVDLLSSRAACLGSKIPETARGEEANHLDDDDDDDDLDIVLVALALLQNLAGHSGPVSSSDLAAVSGLCVQLIGLAASCQQSAYLAVLVVEALHKSGDEEVRKAAVRAEDALREAKKVGLGKHFKLADAAIRVLANFDCQDV